jgi:hypothetical protein
MPATAKTIHKQMILRERFSTGISDGLMPQIPLGLTVTPLIKMQSGTPKRYPWLTVAAAW